MRKGEVWRVRLPFGSGHEQAGERPVIIIQDDAFIPILPLVLVVPLTGEMAASRFVSTLLIEPDAQNGLVVPSVALIFQTRALDKRRFLSRLGILDSLTLNRIYTAHGHNFSFCPRSLAPGGRCPIQAGCGLDGHKALGYRPPQKESLWPLEVYEPLDELTGR